MNFFWKRWKKIAGKVTDFQANIILTIIYIFIIIPIGIIFRLFVKNSQNKSDSAKKSMFIKKRNFKQDLEWAKRQ